MNCDEWALILRLSNRKRTRSLKHDVAGEAFGYSQIGAVAQGGNNSPQKVGEDVSRETFSP
jgi:hypothetical protein